MKVLIYPTRVKGDFWEEHLEGGADGLQVEKKRKDFLRRWKSGFLGDLSGQQQEQKSKKELVWRGWILHLANSF